MPKVARVRLEDGRIARFSVPDDATPEQVMAAARDVAAKPKPKSFWQGVAEGARPFAANAGRIIAAANPVTAAQDAASRLTGLRGPTDVINAYDTAARQSLERSPYRGSTAGHIVGSIAGAAPTMMLPAGPVVQGLAAGAMATDAPEGKIDPYDLAINTAVGGAAGKAGQVLAKPIARGASAVASGVRRVAGRPSAVPVPTTPLAPLGRKAEARAARFKSVGVDDPTTGMVTREPAAFSFEVNKSKETGIGEGLAQQMRGIDEKLIETGRELVRKQGGARGAEATGEAVQTALDTKRTEMQQVTSRLYDQVRETQGEAAAGSLGSFRQALDDPMMTDNPTFDTMREGVTRRLQRLTTPKSPFQEISRSGDERILEYTGKSGKAAYIQVKVGSDGRAEISIDPHSREANRFGPKEVLDAARELRRLYPEIKSVFGVRESGAGAGRTQVVDLSPLSEPAEQGVTINQAEELRKFIGGLGDTRDPAVRMMRGRLIDALDDDVVNAVGDDAFKAARESAKARFGEFQKTYAGRIADEKIAPEKLPRRILGEGASLKDIRAVRQSLTTGTDEQVARGKEAWRALGAQEIDDLLRGAVDPDGALSGSRLYSGFSKNAGKFRELLDPADYKLLKRLANAARDAKAYPAGHSVNTSNTAITGRNMLADMFANAPAQTKRQWLRLLGRVGAHLGAGAVAPGYGNAALEGIRTAGSVVAESRAASVAAQALADKIRFARNPAEAAAAKRALEEAAQSDAAAREVLDRIGGAITVTGVGAQAGTRQ